MLSKKMRNSLFQITLCSILLFLFGGCQKKPTGALEVKVPVKERSLEVQKKDASGKKAKKERKRKFNDLTYKDLKETKANLLVEGKKELAITHLEKMISLCTSAKDLKDLTLELADLLFDSGELFKAEKLFDQFVQLYPGDKDVEYASYKSILCSYWSILSSDRDPSKTKETITLTEKFLSRSDIFTNFSKEVTDILVDCRYRLFETEANVFNFYLSMRDYLSARTRLQNIEKEFMPMLPQIEPQIILMHCDLAKAINNKAELEARQAELQIKYPDYHNAIMQVAQNTKSTFVDKF